MCTYNLQDRRMMDFINNGQECEDLHSPMFYVDLAQTSQKYVLNKIGSTYTQNKYESLCNACIESET